MNTSPFSPSKRPFYFGAALACCLAAIAPALASAGSVRIENYSNDSVFVAVAYNHYKGNTKLFVEAWYEIKQNDSRTITAADADDMYVRIVNKNGGEFTFGPNFQTFLNFPLISNRCTVANEADDANIRVLRWGANLENVRNVNQQNPDYPAGWSNQRFFQIGSRNAKLEVRP